MTLYQHYIVLKMPLTCCLHIYPHSHMQPFSDCLARHAAYRFHSSVQVPLSVTALLYKAGKSQTMHAQAASCMLLLTTTTYFTSHLIYT